MSITTYTELQSAVAAWAKRTDLTSRLPDFIALAERSIVRDLQLRATELSASGTTSGDTIALDPAWGKIERVEIVSDGVRYSLTYTSPNGIEALTLSTGLPGRFTVENGAIRLIPAPASAYSYTVFYIPDLTPLSATNPSNWVLANAPDVYLFGALCHLARFTLDDEAFARYTPMFQGAMDAVKRNDEGQRFPISGGLQIKPRSHR